MEQRYAADHFHWFEYTYTHAEAQGGLVRRSRACQCGYAEPGAVQYLTPREYLADIPAGSVAGRIPDVFVVEVVPDHLRRGS